MAEEIISKHDLAEVLLVNEDDLVTEGHRSNIFFVENDTLVTSFEELVLPGITRDKIKHLATDNDIPFLERNIKAAELAGFDASFLSSTSKNVLPVRRIDNINYSAANPITTKLAVLFDQMVEDHLKKFNWNK